MKLLRTTLGWAVPVLLLLSACSPASEPATEESAAARPGEAAPAAETFGIINGLVPLEGVLVGGQPTPEQIEQLAAAGYRTVINMRTIGEPGYEWEPEKVMELGMVYTQIPIRGAEGLTEFNIDQLAKALYAEDALPALVHCASGNRVGAALALKAAWIDGASAEEAIQLGVDAGMTRLHDTVAEMLKE